MKSSLMFFALVTVFSMSARAQERAQGHVEFDRSGKTRPVTDNNTAAGPQQNRRVELLVSGDPIGASASR